MQPTAADAPPPLELTPARRAVIRGLLSYFDTTVEGIEHLPPGGALLVGNHAMFGIDGIVLGALALDRIGRRIRFLGERNLWRIPGLRSLLDAAGAIPGAPGKAVELLRSGELCGVYPGGIDDSWKLTTTDRYRLQWGTRSGFVKVAMEAGVPIVPVAASGIDEMYDVVAKERWIGRRVLGSPRYDIPLALGWMGTILPRRVALHYRFLPPIATQGDRSRPEDVERVRKATFDALDAELAKLR
jgi:1-acyl-sn-glycerol-3-phosphate acyltransferase